MEDPDGEEEELGDFGTAGDEGEVELKCSGDGEMELRGFESAEVGEEVIESFGEEKLLGSGTTGEEKERRGGEE